MIDQNTPPPPHCYGWMKPEDMVRHALASFYTACRYQDAAHRAFPDGPHPDRDKWVCDLLEILEARLQIARYEADGSPAIDAQDAGEYRMVVANYTEPYWTDDAGNIIRSDREKIRSNYSSGSHNESRR